jgi:hypothetical protein
MTISSSRRSLLKSLIDFESSEYGPVKGVHYFDGQRGDDGREIELRVAEGYIQWRYTNESKWRNLISVEELRGENGEPGADGQTGPIGRQGPEGKEGPQGPEGERVMLQLNGTDIQWCYKNSEKWSTLFSLKDLKGDKGDKGDPGKDGQRGEAGPRGPIGMTGLQGKQGPKGLKGDKGNTGAKGADGKDGVSGLKGDKGDTGPQGPVGPKGDRGPKGPKGDKGDKPVLGTDYFVVPGPAGKNGRDGLNGLDGVGGGDSLLEDSTYTYTDGLVTRIDYESGQYKELTYNVDSTVDTVTWHRETDVVTKTFTYNPDGTVASIDVNIV